MTNVITTTKVIGLLLKRALCINTSKNHSNHNAEAENTKLSEESGDNIDTLTKSGITDAEGNAWDPYMVYEFEKGSMHILGVMEEPYDITDGIPPVPPADYENQFEKWNRASLPCQFVYPNPSDENNGYHLKREEEKPSEFDAFFAKIENKNGVSGEEIRKSRTNHGFIIGNGNRGVGMCVISSAGEKPALTYFWFEEEFRGKGIEEDIKETLAKQN